MSEIFFRVSYNLQFIYEIATNYEKRKIFVISYNAKIYSRLSLTKIYFNCQRR